MRTAASPTSPGAPAWGLMGIEPFRAAFEYLGMQMMGSKAFPEGDGHPVVVFPGLATDGTTIGPLTSFCARLGYAAQDWGRGLNTGPQGDLDTWLDALTCHIHERLGQRLQRTTLIGWSLGGIYAREIAKRMACRVRQVITIGTPFAGSAEATHASWLYWMMSGQRPLLSEALRTMLAVPPPVPTTSIYSRTDGVVAWQACVQPGHPLAENIEIEGSHCGLAWNPAVLSVIADRLGQPEGKWRRFAR